MAWAFVANQQGATVNSNTVSTLDASSGTLNVAAGDLLVCWVKHESGTTSIAVADSVSGNTFTFDAGDKVNHSNGSLCTSFGYVLSASADATFTGRLTLGAARDFVALMVWQFRPDAGETVSKDGSAAAQGASGSINSGNITTTGTDEVVLGGYGEFVASDSTAHQIGGVNATGVLQSSAFGSSVNHTASWYRILSATMTNGAATCSNGSADWTGAEIAFKSVAGGGGGAVNRIFFPPDMSGMGVGGVLGGNRMN